MFNLNDNDDDCEWEFQMDDYEDAGVLHGGTELININQLLHQYDYPELNSIKDLIPMEENIGLVLLVLV